MHTPSDKETRTAGREGELFFDTGLGSALETVGSYYDKATQRFRQLLPAGILLRDLPAHGVIGAGETAAEATPEARVNRDIGDAADKLAGSGRHRVHDVSSLADLAGVEAVLDNVKDAILTLNAQGRVLTCNPAGLRVFGYTADEIERVSVEALLPYKASPRAYLERLSQRADDAAVDLAGQEVEARRRDGSHFTAEITVSRLSGDRGSVFILCLRDITERRIAEQALRESEARFRALVENAADAILVLDVDRNRFVDANGNAATFFGRSRDGLMAVGPGALAAGGDSGAVPFGCDHESIERALAGRSPMIEWVYVDAEGHERNCEVRLSRLPSSRRRLVRISVLDVSARKRDEVLAHGERQVLELIAASAPLTRTLGTICRLLERSFRHARFAVTLLDEDGERLRLAAAPRLPDGLRAALDGVAPADGIGSSALAAAARRQVVVSDLASDASWQAVAPLALGAGLLACCSTPVMHAGERLLGTLDMYLNDARMPLTAELDAVQRFTQLAAIAVVRCRDEQALRGSEARWRELFENVFDGLFQCTPSGQVLAANPALVRMLGHDSEDALRDAGLASLFAAGNGARGQMARALERDGEVRDLECRLQRADGAPAVVVVNARAVSGASGVVTHYEGTLTDITERKRSEQALFEEKERLQVTLQSIGDGVVSTDDSGRVEYMNPMAEQLTGWSAREVGGLPVDQVLRLVDEQDRNALDNPILRCLREGRTVSSPTQTLLLGREGQEVCVQDSAAPIHDRNGRVTGAVMVLHDVSKERRLHRQLSYQASHDQLTGLINRTEFENRLIDTLDSLQHQPARTHALLYLDLDQFKVINDTRGHAAGDHLLRQVTEVLVARIRSSDVLARIGGDEFAILLHDCALGRALQVADDLREAVAQQRYSWQEQAMSITLSIGVVGVNAGTDSASLFSLADVACYAAKEEGRNRVRICEEGDVPERHRQMHWVARISEAVEDDRLELYFQPIVPIGDNPDRRGHYELLLRMRDENGDLVPPSEFIPAAERYNLMPTLDRWVVRETLSRLMCHDGEHPYTVAVNLSGTSLNDPKFMAFLVEELERAQPPEGSLCFEITETAAIANLAQVATCMHRLKALGVRFSLDDFGSGLSSFAYLKSLPVDFLKIDGHFIQNVIRDAIDQSMVDAINKVGLAMGIKTIAERVESGEVLARLAELGVAYAQGYHVAMPRPVAELPGCEAQRNSA